MAAIPVSRRIIRNIAMVENALERKKFREIFFPKRKNSPKFKELLHSQYPIDINIMSQSVGGNWAKSKPLKCQFGAAAVTCFTFP